MNHNGILLVNKASGCTSFSLVALLRRITGVETIGHAGTLDPFATGVMVLLIGKPFTRLSEQFLSSDKEYRATLHLGIETDSYDRDGAITSRSSEIPPLSAVQHALSTFSGCIAQVPPMFSAKKIGGKKLCDLARKGISIERKPVEVQIAIRLIRYEYPELEIEVACSKGTYIRSVAHDIGRFLGCGAHLSQLTRTRSGSFSLSECVPQEQLKSPEFNLLAHLRQR